MMNGSSKNTKETKKIMVVAPFLWCHSAAIYTFSSRKEHNLGKIGTISQAFLIIKGPEDVGLF